MKRVIRVGDPTSHGGKVETGASNFEVDGVPVACVGDRCSCPQDGHENCVIVEGDPRFIIDDRAAAFEGHKTSCGATLIATARNFSSE